jgi:hypothetical protein
VEGRPEPPPDQYPEVFIEPVNKDYFAAYGVQLLRGRTFNNGDMGERPKVVNHKRLDGPTLLAERKSYRAANQ